MDGRITSNLLSVYNLADYVPPSLGHHDPSLKYIRFWRQIVLSGNAPWRIIIDNPVVVRIFTRLCNYATSIFSCNSFKYLIAHQRYQVLFILKRQ